MNKLNVPSDTSQPDKVIDLPCFKIHVELFGHEGPDKYIGGKLTSDGLHEPHPCHYGDEEASYLAFEAAVDAMESLILAHAVAGVDISTPAYVEGIETAIDALLNHCD